MSAHPHSWKSYQACLDTDRWDRLIWIIARFYHAHANLAFTDREIKDALHAAGELSFDDMNMVRPKITTLLDEGYLRERGHVFDEKTHRTVRQVVWDPHSVGQAVQLEMFA